MAWAGGRYGLGRGPESQPFVQVYLNRQYFFCRARAPKTVFIKFLASTLMNSKMETISKKFAALAASAVFVIPFLHQKQPFSEIHFWQEIITLTGTICMGYEICHTNFPCT